MDRGAPVQRPVDSPSVRSRHQSVVVAALLLTFAYAFSASARQATEYGPAKGTLVIAGGGALEKPGILEKFIELAGGPDRHFVIVPTAAGNKTEDGRVKAYAEQDVIAKWNRRGLKNVRMLHTHDPKVADTDEFIAPLKQAHGVWFNGGRQWNIVDSHMNTAAYTEFHRVLERGGV